MRFEIARSPDRAPGLRVIPEIPDYPLCHLEGRNGIGKSAAARLLELATGGQPYAALPNAWRTLKAQLGPTRITVSALPGGRTIVFDVKPDRWPNDAVRELGSLFADVSIDGAPATTAVAHSVLRVRRISGDETLVQTLARDLDERGVIARALETQHVRPAADHWDLRLHGLTHLIGDISRDTFAAAWQTQQDRAHAVAAAIREAEEAVAIAALAATAAAACDGLARRRRDLPRRLDELVDAQAALDQAQPVLDTATTLVQDAAVALAATGAVRAEIDKWERLLVFRQRALQRARIQESQLLGALDLAETPSAQEIATISKATADAVAEAIDKRDATDLVEPLRGLTENLEQSLALEEYRLGPEVVALTAPPVSVDGLLAGVRARHTELGGQPRADDVLRLEREIEDGQRRQTLLRELSKAMATTQRKQQRLHEAQQELSGLFANLAESDRAAYEAAQADVEAARDAFIAAEVQVREVRKQIAELLDIDPLPPQSTADHPPERDVSPPAGDAEDAADEAAPPPDSLYPALDAAAAIEAASTKDAEAVVALDAVAADVLVAVAGHDDALDLSELRAAAAADPLEPLDPLVVDALRALHATASQAAASAEARRGLVFHAMGSADDARDQMEHLRDNARHALTVLTGPEDDEWGQWARAASPLLAAGADKARHGGPIFGGESGPSDDDLLVLDALEAVATVARAQAAAARGVVDQLATLSGYLRAEAGRIAPRVGEPDTTQAGDYLRTTGRALQEWVERELAELLTAPELLLELFDDAQHVRVQLDDMTLTWHPPAGGIRKRPIEAFSSGEQVFAYTRANLARLSGERQPGQAVVVFLDEFGAFVARDRLGQLMDFVEHEALGRTADQVVVMLPLARSYPNPPEDDAKTAAVTEDSISERARQVDERGYFAVPFSSGRAHLA